MDPEEKVRSGGGREREPLRPVLDQWKVPEPPREIEWQLRRTFRQGRAGHRRLKEWLAAAVASLILIVVLLDRRGQDAKPRSVVEQAAAAPAPIGMTAEPHHVEVPAAAAPPPRVTRRARARRPAEPEVLVEPRQAELLLQLARSLRGTRQAPPALSMPRVEVVGADAPAVAIPEAQPTEVPAHRTEWGTVAGQWPPIHLPL